MNKPLTFKSGADAFDYTTNFFTVGELQKDEAIYGLITAAKSDPLGIDDEEYTIKVSIKKKGFFSSGREIRYVDAILHPDLNLNIKIGDLVLWGCADPNAKPNPFGVIVKQFQLYLSNDNKQFTEVISN